MSFGDFLVRKTTGFIYNQLYAPFFDHIEAVSKKETVTPDLRFVCGGIVLGWLFGGLVWTFVIGFIGYLIGAFVKECFVTKSTAISKLSTGERIALVVATQKLVGGSNEADIDAFISTKDGKQKFFVFIGEALKALPDVVKEIKEEANKQF